LAAPAAQPLRITVQVTPRARRPGVEPLPDGTFRVRVAAAPHDGEANEAVMTALAEHFGVGRSRVRIVGGRRARRKIVEIR
jgi:uncharacterized protein YggU (UPF0235/DUF167 family)